MNLASGFSSCAGTDLWSWDSLLSWLPIPQLTPSVRHLPGVIMVRSVLFWPHWCHPGVSSELDNIIIILAWPGQHPRDDGPRDLINEPPSRNYDAIISLCYPPIIDPWITHTMALSRVILTDRWHFFWKTVILLNKQKKRRSTFWRISNRKLGFNDRKMLDKTRLRISSITKWYFQLSLTNTWPNVWTLRQKRCLHISVLTRWDTQTRE